MASQWATVAAKKPVEAVSKFFAAERGVGKNLEGCLNAIGSSKFVVDVIGNAQLTLRQTEQ